MNDLLNLVEAAKALRREKRSFMLATVVRVHGTAYRKPGARMIFTEDAWIAGSASGGCLERDLLEKAWGETRQAEPAMMTFDSRIADATAGALGLGCEGVVDVLLERMPAAEVDPLAFIGRCIETQTRGVIATVVRGPGLGARVLHPEWDAGAPGEIKHLLTEDARLVKPVLREFGETEVLFEPVIPPPRLFLFGHGYDAQPVAHFGTQLGWEVFICDQEEPWSMRERFAGCGKVQTGPLASHAAKIDASADAFAVVMNHDFARDRETLAMLLRSRARYIGMLGPRQRTERILVELMRPWDERIHAPPGLSLGGESPAEIALEIVSEVQARRHHAGASSLCRSVAASSEAG